MRRVLLILILIACTGCATMDPTTQRAMGIGASLGFIAWGIASLSAGHVLEGAALLGGEALGWGVYGAVNTPAGDAQPVPPQTIVSER